MRDKHNIETVFLDRDGVINRECGHITDLDELYILEPALLGLRKLHQAGLRCVVITNQSGIARGLLSVEKLESIHQSLTDTIERAGGRLQAIYYCPYHPDPGPSGVPEFSRTSRWRKPDVGMFEQAANDLGIQLDKAVMVGDSEKDYLAATKLGLHFLGVESPKAPELRKHRIEPHEDLSRAADAILAMNGPIRTKGHDH